MSTTIEERVVSLQFDNSRFEKNVSTTMSSIDKLKQSFKFDGASKGLSDINSAVGKVNMAGLGSAVETVSAKFSALQVMGVTALANITNSAINAGKRMIKALTLDPVMSGFKEYETQINATQTILANTSHKGSTIDDVNRALEELNKYADLTIYNFTEMTRNIGTFTAAGIDLDTSVNAIQGIANLAAVSGSTSQQASTAMYQLSQALSTGTVRLMDWNSVVNAGMGGEIFQNALKQTSRELETGADAAIKATGSFRESLRSGWLTAEVLTETLKKFTTSGANEYVAEYTGLSADAVEAALEAAKAEYGEADAIKEASKALAEKSGKNAQEIADMLEFAKNATDAATKVKTFTQLWDVLKEAAQSGWAQTWKIIVGDFEEAKGLLTPLSEFMTGLINGISDWRNKLLESALGRTFNNLRDRLNEVMKPANAVVDTVKGAVDAVTDLGQIVDDVILGKFGNGAARYHALTEAGINYYEVQNRVNEKLGDSYRHSEKLVQQQNRLLGIQKQSSESSEEQAVAISELGDEQKKELKRLAKLVASQKVSNELSDDQIAAFEELNATAAKLGMSTDDFIDNLDQIDGRWLIINSFKNAGKGLLTIFNAMKEAWQNIFPPKSIEERSDKIFNLIGALHKFSTNLLVNKDNAEKFRRTFEGIFAILDMVATIVGGGFRIAFKIISSVLSYFHLNILDVTAAIGNAAVRFHDWFESLFDISGALDAIVPVVAKVIEYIKKLGNAIKESEAFAIANDVIDGLINGLTGRATEVWEAAQEIARQVWASICDFLGIESPSKLMEEVGGYTIDGFVLGIQNGSSAVWESIQGIFGKIVGWIRELDFGAVVAGLVGIGTVKAASTAANALDKIASPIEGVSELVTNTAIMVKKVTRPLKNVVKGVAQIEKAVAFNIAMDGVKTLALSLLMLVGAVAILSLCDENKLWNAVKVVGVLAAVLVALSFVMSKVGSASASFNLKDGLNIQGLTMGLVGIGAAIALIAVAVKMLGNMEPDQIEQAFKGLFKVVLAIGLVLGAFALLNFGSGKAAENIGKLGGTLVKLSIALLLMAAVVKVVGKLSEDEITKGIVFLGGFLAFLLLFNLIALMPSINVDAIGGMMLKMSIAMLLMVGVVKLAGKLTVSEMTNGAIFLAGFAVFVGVLAGIGALGGKGIDGVGKMMMSLSVALLLMVAAVKLIGMLSVSEITKGGLAVAAFGIIITYMVKNIMRYGSEAPKIAATILALSVAVGILAAVAIVCSMISVAGLAKGIIAVGLLSTMVTAMVMATRGATSITSTIVAISVAIGVLVAAVAVLTMIEPSKLAIATAAVTILMGMLVLIVKIAGTAQKAVPVVLALAGIIVLIGGVLYLLGTLPIEVTESSVIALSALLLSLTTVLAILTVIGPAATAAYPAMGALAALIGGLLVVLLALGDLSKIEGFNELIADGGATLSLIGQALGAFVGSIVAGFAASVLTILPLFGMALSGFMAGVTPFIRGVKMIDASVLEGIAVLSAAILALTAANVVAGMLSLGGIGLIGLGLSLSGFIKAAMPFIQTAANIKPEMVEGVKSLAETILILTAAGVLDGIASFVGGGASLETFATQLPKLGEGLSKFSTSLGEFTDEQLATVNCAAKAIKTLAQASSEIPNAGGLLGALVGENNLGTFAEQFPVLATGLRGFLDNIGEFTDSQVATVTAGANAVAELAKAAKDIPNEGGWLGKIVGENNLDTFAEQFPVLATGLRGFLDNIGTLDDSATTTVVAGANAVAELAKAAKDIPNEGGWLGKIVGDNNLSDFANNFPALGSGLKGFVDNVGTFSDGQVTTVGTAVRAINTLTDLANADLSSATTYLPAFGDVVAYFANDLATFCEEMPEYSDVLLASSSITTLLNSVKDIGDANTGVLSTFASNLKKLGKDAVNKFIEAFSDKAVKTDIKEEAVRFAEEAIEGVKSKIESMKTAGKDLANGLILGIEAKESAVYWAAYELGKKAVQGEKDGQKSNSPSKATIQAGKWLGEGLVIGIGEMGRKVYNAGHDLGKSATNSISSAVSNIANAINTDIDTQPTIRPVLDLSDVQSGAVRLGNLLGGKSVGVRANVGAISYMMNSRSQNGTNADVVSAIDKLNKKMDNFGNTTYQVNGVTYDDGSNIAEAVRTITRAAVRERRT